jgi:hypothetical protein
MNAEHGCRCRPESSHKTASAGMIINRADHVDERRDQRESFAGIFRTLKT